MTGRPVRIRGAVRAGGRGLGRVRVTDGVTVVQTASDGQFELVSHAGRRFVYLTLPAGYAIPRQESGTAHFFRPIAPDGRGEMEAVFELQPLASSDEAHTFVVLADTQMEDAYEVGLYLDQTVPDVRALAEAQAGTALFGVACGDIVFDHPELFPDYEKGVRQMGLPFFQVVGNHDLTFDARADAGSNVDFERRFGPPYYSFDRGAVHYVVLDDVLWHGSGYIGYLDETQLAWLEQDLSFVEAGRPVVVFLHIPTLSTIYARNGERAGITSAVTNREALFRLLEPYQAHLVAGHTHEKDHRFEGRIHEHVSGAACGAWWSGPICYDGTPNGYDVFEVDGESLTWRYKSTGHDFDHQMRVYARGSDPAAPDEIVANVWDWDPAWQVVWYEGGARRGAMARRTGRDPLSIRLHAGPDLPTRRTWVDPEPTYHLFYAPVSPDARDVVVEATDRFGRTYTGRPAPDAPAGSTK